MIKGKKYQKIEGEVGRQETHSCKKKSFGKCWKEKKCGNIETIRQKEKENRLPPRLKKTSVEGKKKEKGKYSKNVGAKNKRWREYTDDRKNYIKE